MGMLLNPFQVVPSFLPTSITGMVGWWDAQDGGTITHGTPPNVQQWDDKSGQGHNLSQGTGSKRPATVIVNGRQMLEFDGGDENLIITPNPTGLNFSGDFEIHVVYRTTDTDRGDMLAKGSAIRYHIRVNNQTPTDDLMCAIDDDTASKVIEDTAEDWNDDTVRIVGMVRDGNNLRQFEDFNETGSSPLDITGYGSLVNTGNFFVGAFDGASNFFDGDLGEIVMYDNALSAGDRDDLRDYLKNKWAVS